MSEGASQSDALKIVVVDESKEALDHARDRADARLDAEMAEGGRFRRFVKGIWKGNIAKEYYRQKYTRQEVKSIQDTQDVLIESPADARTRALETTIRRFQMEADEVIHTEAGERREVQASDSEIATGLQTLVRQYCEGTLNDVTLREERTRFLQEYRAIHGEEVIGKGIATTDNILDIARAVKGAVDHGESLDAAIGRIEVITGEARNGARTEARYNAVDRVIDKVAKTKLGSLVGPELVAGSVTLAASIAKWGSHSVVGAVTKTILPGVAAGAWAALRENKRFKDERAQHMRESAQGAEFDDSAKRRSELESTRYETQTAQSLTEHLEMVTSTEFFDEGGEAALRAALEALAAVETRIKLSDTKNIDLITYKDATSIGDERMQLDLARAAAKVELNGRLTEGHRELLGFSRDSSLQDIITAHSETYISAIEQDISEKDKVFQRLKATRVAKAAAIGVATGLAGGVIVQEGIAAIDPTRAGLFEQIWGGNDAQIPVNQLGTVEQHQTILQGLVQGEHTTIHTGPSGDYVTESFAENSELSVSNDHEVVDNGDGTFSLVDPNGVKTAENIAINPDGSLPQDSIEQLESLGMIVEDNSFDQEVVTTVQQEVAANQYIQNHIAETTSVTRELWYGNDTPGIYDQNELRVYRGGSAEAPGIVEGGYQYTVAGMHPDGSWQGGESVDWNQAAASGNLFVAVSGTVDTQGNPFMIPIGPDGAVNIPSDSPAGQFFANENGSVAFNGAYMEIVQTTGVTAEGEVTIRPLATLVGDESASFITDTITTTTIEHHANYEITTAGYDTIQDNFTEMAPVTPVESRRNLETPRTRQEMAYYYQGAEYLDPAEIIARREETSPRLLDNPEADLNPREEFSWYRKLLTRKRGAEYVADIDQTITNTPELAQLSSDIKTIVQIPVNAAGGAESSTIYTTLTEAYGRQSQDALSKTLIVMHVNWFDQYPAATDEAELRANIEKTRAEIARAKTDNPNLQIAVIETEWQRSEIQGGIIGHVSRKLNDSILLSLDRAHSEGRASTEDDVLIVRNDADPKGLSTGYLKNYTSAFETNGRTDIFTGTTTFDNTKANRAPGFVFAGNFMQSIDLLSALRDGSVHTGGANFGVRASTFAAVGGVGFDDYTGAGSDDVNVGRRIKSARTGLVATGRRGLSGYIRSLYKRNSGGGGTSRVIAKRVSARIDTDSDREETMYANGIPIVNTWNPENGFDENSFKARDSGLQTVTESLRDNPAQVIERIRHDMEGSINGMQPSPSIIDSALNFAFLGIGKRGYTLTQSIVNGRPRYKLEFTPEGAKYLVNHLTRDSKGRFDSYGARKMRQMYGQAKVSAKRQPTHESFIQV